MGEVHCALAIVCVDTSHWCLVTLKQVQYSCSGAVSASCVHCPLLTAHYEVVDIVLWEGEACDGHRLALLVLPARTYSVSEPHLVLTRGRRVTVAECTRFQCLSASTLSDVSPRVALRMLSNSMNANVLHLTLHTAVAVVLAL